MALLPAKVTIIGVIVLRQIANATDVIGVLAVWIAVSGAVEL